jgi:hypothetical protein
MTFLLQIRPNRVSTVPVEGEAKNRSGGSFGEGDDRENWAPTGWCDRQTAYRDYRDIQTIFVRPQLVYSYPILLHSLIHTPTGMRRRLPIRGFRRLASLHISPFFVTRAPSRRYGGVHGVEGGEGVADNTSNRLHRAYRGPQQEIGEICRLRHLRPMPRSLLPTHIRTRRSHAPPRQPALTTAPAWKLHSTANRCESATLSVSSHLPSQNWRRRTPFQ